MSQQTTGLTRSQVLAVAEKYGEFQYGDAQGDKRLAFAADLIAARKRIRDAAPELLAALEAFLRAPSVGSNGPGSSTIVVQDFNLRAARAAVEKAVKS